MRAVAHFGRDGEAGAGGDDGGKRVPLAAAPPEEDALVCGNDPEAKALVLELASRIVSGRALDAGSLVSARALENLTALIINLNKRYRAHAGIRVTGIS